MQSVIISSYNKPQHLGLVLEGLRWQEHAKFEVLVADDGSGPETAEVIEKFQKGVDFRVEHIWQEDQGFRAARIRNLGVKAARSDQLVFLDGDCIPYRGFLAAHAAAATSRSVLAGDRLFLDEETSLALTPKDVAENRFTELLPPREMRRLRWRALKNHFYSWTRLKERPKVVTANLGMAKSAFEEVNGLDERFVGWGHEDEDLRRRLVRRGYQIRSVLTSALVCHLWHRQVESFRGRVKYGDNVDYFRRGFYLSRCRKGLRELRLAEYSIAWNGDPGAGSEPVEIAIAWGETPRWCECEVRVQVVNGVPPRRNGGESSSPHLYLTWDASAMPEPDIIKLDEPINPDTELGRGQLLAALEKVL